MTGPIRPLIAGRSTRVGASMRHRLDPEGQVVSMVVLSGTKERPAVVRIGPGGPTRRHGWLGIASIALGLGLIANSLLGPLIAGLIAYPFSKSMLNQTIGLEAVSLLVVAPLCILAGVLAIRGNAAAPLLGFGPAAYTAYMFLQYVVGPEYRYYPGALPLHLALFALGAGTSVAAWASVDPARLPHMRRPSERRYAVLLMMFAAFIVSRYVPALLAGIRGEPLTAESRNDVSMYWSIFLLDLGIVVPATIAAAVGLLRDLDWGRKALFAVLGWFALVPASVAAMSVVMVVRNDPNASVGQATVFTIAALVFTGLAFLPFRRLFMRSPDRTEAME
jgi:hypothetical protein